MLFLEILFRLPPLFVLAIVVFIVIREYKKTEQAYLNSSYYQITKQPRKTVKYNKGLYGEYLIYLYLREYEKNGAKLLFNLYIPKENGETTEIDILMICSKGIFVFESKNYSGWIFGNETQKNWCQTLPIGRGISNKEFFYNPILQNNSHINHLQTFIEKQVPTWSIIVFSNRCTLKDVHVSDSNIYVINLYDVQNTVSDIFNQISANPLTDNTISEICNKLYPYTQVDENTKSQHIASIHYNKSQQLHSSFVSCTTPPAETEVIKTSSSESIIASSATSKVEIKCPKCNGNLILRTATKGAKAGEKFYGCSNFPKCRYIQNIK